MNDWMSKSGNRSRLVNWLGLDAWIDSSLYGLWQGFKDRWSAASSFAAQFRLNGIGRLTNELVSEAANLGTAGMVLMLMLAIPAFETITGDNWLETGQYSITFTDRNGEEIGKRGILLDDAVPLEEIPDHLIKAVMATEDRRFFDHFGIDVFGTMRALMENLRANGVVQGGSSLTQQVAKNLFLTSERSLSRKIKEAFLALWLENRLTKKEILKLYLDRAYMGGGTFGVEAASQFYFGKSVRDINLSESAILAGLFKAPTTYAPHNNLAASRARANEVLTNLVQAGFMTEGQVYGARLNPAKIVETIDRNSPDYYLDWAFEEVQRLMAGKPDFVLFARTTFDPALQRAADEAVETTLRQEGRSYRVQQAALVGMEPNGAVRALVGGRDYGESQFNRATRSKRQPGSSFKPYVYLTALQHGYHPNSTVVDGPVNCNRWSPKNYSGGYSGRMTMTRALAKSINTIAVKLSLEVGREAVLENIRKLGIQGPRASCSMALGDAGISPLEHTGGYATFANGGLAVTPYAIVEIRNSREETVYLRERDEPEPERIFEEQQIGELNQMLSKVVIPGEGTARNAYLDFTTAAGKTGTTSAYKDAWFMGYTGKYVAGVWFGNDDLRPTARVTGGSLPAKTWNLFMTAAHTSPDIPLIPGLPMHPNQVAEMNRVASLKRSDPTFDRKNARDDLLMSADTRAILEDLSQRMRAAAGIVQGTALEPAPKVDGATGRRAALATPASGAN